MNSSRIAIAALAGLAALLALAPAASASAADQCPKGFRCLDVAVPLDRSGTEPGAIELPVAVERGDGPVMFALGGGPGQGMFRTAGPIAGLLGPLTDHRIATFDQRGTGAVALRCGGLQESALTDYTPPLPGTVEECGEQLGAARAFYSTTDTVADLDAVRAAIGEERVALLGISYGTYTAERYARAHPQNVSSLVLDSVVPQEDVDPFAAASMRRAGRLLEQLCKPRRSRCARATKHPVRDLERLVKRTAEDPIRGRFEAGGERIPLRVDGPGLFDLIAGLASFAQDRFPRFPGAVKAALRGREKKIVAMYADYREQNQADAAELSWGLHTATICADVAFPWGSPSTDPAARGPAVDAALAAIPAKRFGPFGRATAAGGGLVETCRRWQPTSVAPPPEPGPLPAVPILILAGTWDLSTPLPDARREARRSPTAELVRLREVGHSAITSVACAQRALSRFYAEEPLGRPCHENRAPRN